MMPSYSDIKKHCEESSKISKDLIDDFLIYYAADKERLVPVMDSALKKYKSAAKDIPESYLNYLKSEYIGHRIFKKDGFISKYLDRPEIRNLPKDQYQHLLFNAKNPWRFSFATITGSPENSFFEMEDVMTGHQYLLYSPGMQTSNAEINSNLWFNLIAFNGRCWQTYGLIIPFKSFTADDIFFFATELNPRIENEEMLMEEVENNPFPFFMLLSASNLPSVVSRGHETMFIQSTDDMEDFKTDNLSTEFTVDWNKDVYCVRLNKYGEFPHYAVAYYHEKKKKLIRSAMTMAGFESLSKSLSEMGYKLNMEADIAVSISMLSVAKKVLEKHIDLNPYEKLFSKTKKEVDSQELERLNRFMALAVPYINAGKEIDVKQLAREADLDEITATSIWNNLKESLARK